MNTKIDYDELNAELTAIHAGVRAAECHGFLSGHFCTSNSIVIDSWQEHLLAGIDDVMDLEDGNAILSQLATQVAEEIVDDELLFTVLLPDDETTMSERSNALAEWCAGFVSGAGIGGLGENRQLSRDCDEFIKDIVAISRMETSVEDGEDAETDLFEIVEYIRVGVILLHQECSQMDNNDERPEVLH